MNENIAYYKYNKCYYCKIKYCIDKNLCKGMYDIVVVPKKPSDKYNSIHKQNLRKFTKTGVCENCSKTTKTHWSHKTHIYTDRERHNWQELCASCHFIYDRDVLGVKYGRTSKLQKTSLYKH